MMMSTGTRAGNSGLPADILEDGTNNQTQQFEENIDTFTPQCKLLFPVNIFVNKFKKTISI